MLRDRRKDALRSLIISQRLLGTREIALFHHTGCGMVTFTTPQLRDIVRSSNATSPEIEHIDFLEFPEAEAAVKSDVEWLKSQPLILPETVITGWIYEVETGRVCDSHS
jgi:carbonic anhydrase